MRFIEGVGFALISVVIGGTALLMIEMVMGRLI